jgi:superfamily II DNA/RNA helicase
LLFSATMPAPIKKLADKFLDNPKLIEVARPATTNVNITQWLVPVASAKKRARLRDLLRQDEVHTAIIFCNRKSTVRELNKSLRRSGFRTGEIHGDMDQPQRLAELELYKRGEVNLLVASDVAARGLDIKGVSTVVNFDAPWHPDDYVHRIGRTGRAGATGTAYTFVTDDDVEHIADIEKLTGQTINRLEALPSEPDEDDQPAPRERREEPAPRRGRGKRSAASSASPPPPTTPARRPSRQPEPESETSAPGEWNGPIPDFLQARIEL